MHMEVFQQLYFNFFYWKVRNRRICNCIW